MWMRAFWPGASFFSCVSLKFASIHVRPSATMASAGSPAGSIVPACRRSVWLTMPSTGARTSVRDRFHSARSRRASAASTAAGAPLGVPPLASADRARIASVAAVSSFSRARATVSSACSSAARVVKPRVSSADCRSNSDVASTSSARAAAMSTPAPATSAALVPMSTRARASSASASRSAMRNGRGSSRNTFPFTKM